MQFKKSIILFLVLFLSSFIYVKAETFHEGDYLVNQFVIKESEGNREYIHMRFLYDSYGTPVYTLEPFVPFQEGSEYKVYEEEEQHLYEKLSKEQLRRISLISYMGYGLLGRTMISWYTESQVLIWQTVDPEATFYYASSLGGEPDMSHEQHLTSLRYNLNLFEATDVDPFALSYLVSYGENIVIPRMNDYNVVSSDYSYTLGEDNKLYIQDIKKEGTLVFQKKSDKDRFGKKSQVYETEDGPDIFVPGDIEHIKYPVSVSLNKGNVVFQLEEQEQIFSTMSEKENICYSFFREGEFITETCAREEEISVELPNGEYTYYQTKNGLGYIWDREEHRLSINSDKKEILLPIHKFKKVFQLEKSLCKQDTCELEQNAVFLIYDHNKTFVGKMTTDEYGLASYELGYGTYEIVQEVGEDGYHLVEPFYIRIEENQDLSVLSLLGREIEEPVADVDFPPEEYESIFVPESFVESEGIRKDFSTVENPATGNFTCIQLLKFLFFSSVILIFILFKKKTAI